MKKTVAHMFLLFLPVLALTGCTGIGEKTASISIIYAITAILAFVLLIGYFCLVKKKDIWFIVLYVSVLVVNIGYFSLSASRDLSDALLANRMAYLGSVFLPLSMFVIITNMLDIKRPKWVTAILVEIAAVVFCIAASPGYLDIYYRSVSLETVNGVSVLVKEYGDWHVVYLVYLLTYFGAMVGSIVYSVKKKKLKSTVHVVIFASAVFVNIGVWLIEQLVKLDFEMLSISYIISELFLLGIYLVMQENEGEAGAIPSPEPTVSAAPAEPERQDDDDDERIAEFEKGVTRLTHTERAIYELYISGKSTKDVLAALDIKENTLKFHNKNIYGKLGVSSRKQLLQIYDKVSH